MTSDFLSRVRLLALGRRAVDYYIDTGLCVFCDADDVLDIPHDDCDVGTVSGMVVDEARKKEKQEQRTAFARFVFKQF